MLINLLQTLRLQDQDPQDIFQKAYLIKHRQGNPHQYCNSISLNYYLPFTMITQNIWLCNPAPIKPYRQIHLMTQLDVHQVLTYMSFINPNYALAKGNST